jgi:hypothetical protein
VIPATIAVISTSAMGIIHKIEPAIHPTKILLSAWASLTTVSCHRFRANASEVTRFASAWT